MYYLSTCYTGIFTHLMYGITEAIVIKEALFCFQGVNAPFSMFSKLFAIQTFIFKKFTSNWYDMGVFVCLWVCFAWEVGVCFVLCFLLEAFTYLLSKYIYLHVTVDRGMDGRTDRWTDRWTERRKDRIEQTYSPLTGSQQWTNKAVDEMG